MTLCPVCNNRTQRMPCPVCNPKTGTKMIDLPHAEFVDTATEEAYSELLDILDEAFEFAAYGKGAERHGNGLPWRDQPHFHIAKDVGHGFPVGQAIKKLREGFNMDDPKACRREWLGAITYIASAIFALDQGVE